MGPGMHQPLPSLEMFMREAFGPESGAHCHGKSNNLATPQIIESDRRPSPTSYQHNIQKQMGMTIPRIPISTGNNHYSIHNESNHCTSGQLDIAVNPALSIPSPISPRTRCPSLADSVFTSGACPSPIESGPTTPTSENGGNAPSYGARSNIQRAGLGYETENCGYRHGRSQSPLSVHHLVHHRGMMHNSPLSMHGTAGYHPDSDEDSPMALEHHEEKITKQEKRRRNHLNSEKRRRENIKGGMDALVDLVPSCRNIQESKANILKKTRDYVYQILNGYKEAQMELKRVKAENAELRRLLALHGAAQQNQAENLVYRTR